MIENGEMKCFNEKLSFLKDLPTKFSIESGQEINMVTNIYPINCTLDSPPKLYQYQVNINPEPENNKMACSLICSTLFPDGGPILTNPDWSSLVYLDQDHMIISSRDNLAKNEVSHINKQGKDYEIKISLIKEILLQDNFSDFNEVANTTIYRCFTKLDFSSLDDNFINNRDYIDVNHLRLVGGFHPKIDFFSNNLCLVLDTASRIDRKGTLYDILLSGVGNISLRQAIEDSLGKMSYVTRHLMHQQTVKIHKVRWNSKAQTEKYNDHSNTTIAEYFMSQYNFVAKPDDPIVDIISNGKIESLPASALSQVGITEVERADSRLMSAFHDALFLDPVNLKQKLDSIVLNIKNDNQTVPILKNFGLSIGDSLNVKGRILDPPQLIARSKESSHQIIYLKQNNRMEFDVSNVSCAVNSRINSIPLIIAPESLESQVRDIFLDRFSRIANGIGLSFNYPELLFLNNFHYNTLKNEIFSYIRKFGVPSFIIFFFTEKNQQRYDSLNQLLMSSLGIPSQFILADSIFNRRMGVDDEMTNIAFQLTAKTGGIPYYVPLPLRRTLIIGVTSFVNETENSNQISVCLSASIDQTCARFYSDTFLLNSNEFIPDNIIARFVKNAKEKFKDMVREIPTGLIVYRLLNKNQKNSADELLKISKSELPSFKEAFNLQCDFEKGIPIRHPKSFVFIAVQESSTIRLFTHNDDKVENPRPGTIVFDPASGLADFYLVSNYTQLGTAMPVRYIILNNVNQETWTDERIAQLTYYLCFNYCNFPGAVKLPSPLTNSLNIATFSHQHLNDLPPSNILKQKIVNFV